MVRSWRYGYDVLYLTPFTIVGIEFGMTCRVLNNWLTYRERRFPNTSKMQKKNCQNNLSGTSVFLASFGPLYCFFWHIPPGITDAFQSMLSQTTCESSRIR